MRRRGIVAAGVALALPALAQPGYPNRPIRLVVPAGVGGGTDILARLLATRAAAALRGTIVIENRGGGDGLIGTEYVVRAPADGHVVLFSDPSPYLGRVLRARMPFDPLRDLVPVMRTAVGSIILYAHPGFGVRDVAGLVARAKADPGGVSYGTSSTVAFLLGQLLRQRAGIELVHVPYRSGGQALSDVLSGHLPLTFNGVSNGRAHVMSGELVAVAAAGAARNPSLPAVPTFEEQGQGPFPPGSEWGVFVAAGTPQPIQEALYAAFREAAFDPAMAPRFAELGYVADGAPGAAYQEDMARQLRLWAEVATAAGLTPQ
jgi:tripartite-type tricarboxylate transporter receptor subunit TctC